MRIRPLLAIVLALPLATAGCPAVLVGAGAAAGAGALVWQRGWLRGNIPEPAARVHRAARSALADFKITVESHSLTPKLGTVDATMPDGRRVVVETRPQGAKESQVRIRVGIWGDQEMSLRIYEQIKKHL